MQKKLDFLHVSHEKETAAAAKAEAAVSPTAFKDLSLSSLR